MRSSAEPNPDGIAVEDTIVLAEALAGSTSIANPLHAYSERRFERCRMVVDNSLRLGEIESTGGSKKDHPRIMRDTMMALAGPIP
jgi:hypothetical protein